MLYALVALAEALFYLGAVPLYAALLARSGEGAGVGVAAFDPGAARAMARRRLTSGGKGGRKPGLGEIWPVLRRTRLRRLTLTGRLGLGDAAATALACGALTALGGALRGMAEEADVRVSPLFGETEIRVELQGMISATVGNIIAAAAKNGIDQITGRIAQWRSIPSRTS